MEVQATTGQILTVPSLVTTLEIPAAAEPEQARTITLSGIMLAKAAGADTKG
jgi:hypothetical protein